MIQEFLTETPLHLPTAQLSELERCQLEAAHRCLQNPSLAARLSNIVGAPIEIGFQLMPKRWYRKLHDISQSSVARALDASIASFHHPPQRHSRDGYHKLLGMATGAAGGAFGLPALVLELPVTTTLMLRSIADIARTYGEDLQSEESRLSCIQVFALGARTEEDDAAETGYYGVRLALSMSLLNAQQHILQHGLAAAPGMVRLVSAVAARFGVSVQQKAAAQMVPVIGALGGAAINTIFMQHFQETAHAHFTLRRLERKYGQALIQAEYEKLSAND